MQSLVRIRENACKSSTVSNPLSPFLSVGCCVTFRPHLPLCYTHTPGGARDSGVGHEFSFMLCEERHLPPCRLPATAYFSEGVFSLARYIPPQGKQKCAVLRGRPKNLGPGSFQSLEDFCQVGMLEGGA